MLRRYHITLGATTSAGGKVTTASAQCWIDGERVALEDDKLWCPQCASEGIIKLDGPRLTEWRDGRQVALSDDLCICKCNPPPRLISRQTEKYQEIDTEFHAAQALAAARLACRSLDATSAQTPDDASIRLLHPLTCEPLKYTPYRLQFIDRIIEGLTDSDGYSRPVSATDRAGLIAWEVSEVAGAAACEADDA